MEHSTQSMETVMTNELDGKTALITGASAGLGVDFADRLAARGADVLLVARREEKLRDVAERLMSDYDIDADTVSMDLARPEAGQELYDQVNERGHQVDILINNAGFGIWGKFLDAPWDAQHTMLNLDILTPVHLTRLFAADMVERKWGRIMQVGSIGAFQPSPNYAAYSAAKSFIRSWSEAIDFELREHGVSCTVVNPGVTETEFFDSAGQSRRTWFQRLTIMDSPKVAEIGVKAMLNQRMSIVPGFLNAFNTWMNRWFPRRLSRWVAHHTMKDAGHSQ